MEKSPIFDKLKGKVNSLKEGNDDGDYTDTEQDVLAFYRIPSTVEIPEDVLTANEMKKVRFTRTKPVGFHPQQVEEFHAKATNSIKFYLKTLEKRDQHIHKLATEVDKYKTDFMNTKYQLEVFQGMGGQALVDEQGNYLKESDVEDNEKLIIEKDNEIVSLQNTIQMLKIDLAKAQNSTAPDIPNNSSLTNEERIELEGYRENEEALKEWEEEVNRAYSALEDENSRLLNENELLKSNTGSKQKMDESEEKIESLNNHVQELNDYIDLITSQLEESKNSHGSTSQEINSMQEKIETLSKELDEATNVAHEIEDARKELESQYNELVNQLNEKENELADSSSNDNSFEELNQNINDLNDHIDKLQDIITQKDEENNELYETVQELQTKLANAQSGGITVVDGYKLPPGVKPEDLGL